MRSFARPSQLVSSAEQDRETGADAGDDERDDEDKSHEFCVHHGCSATHWAPHGGHDCPVHDHLELPHLEVSLSLVASIVPRIARLKVRREAGGIPAPEISGQVRPRP